MTQEFLINADYDVQLLFQGKIPNHLQIRAREFGIHFLAALPSCDSVVLYDNVPQKFLNYLEDCGFRPPRIVPFGHATPKAAFLPFAWDKAAVCQANMYEIGKQKTFPSINIVQRVNSKVFSHKLENKMFGNIHGSFILRNSKHFDDFFTHQDGEWVVKAEFGNAALANRRIGPKGRGLESARKFIESFSCRFIVEPWHNRLMDIGCSFNLTSAGQYSNFVTHRLLNTPGGGFLGIEISQDSCLSGSRQILLQAAAEGVAQALTRAGYWGAAGLDSYIFKNNQGEEEFRPVTEINARLTMAFPAHRLYELIEGQGVLLWRMFPLNRLSLPDSVGAFRRELGNKHFYRDKKSGIMALSPWELEAQTGSRVPAAASFLFYGQKAGDTADLVELFKKKFQK